MVRTVLTATSLWTPFLILPSGTCLWGSTCAARYFHGMFSRSGPRFSFSRNCPYREKTPWWQTRLLDRDRWPNLRAARAPRQVPPLSENPYPLTLSLTSSILSSSICVLACPDSRDGDAD